MSYIVKFGRVFCSETYETKTLHTFKSYLALALRNAKCDEIRESRTNMTTVKQ